MRTLLEVMFMFITLIEVMILQVCTYIQIHQIVCILCVQFSVYRLSSDKLFKKGKKSSGDVKLNSLISSDQVSLDISVF